MTTDPDEHDELVQQKMQARAERHLRERQAEQEEQIRGAQAAQAAQVQAEEAHLKLAGIGRQREATSIPVPVAVMAGCAALQAGAWVGCTANPRVGPQQATVLVLSSYTSPELSPTPE